MRAQRDAARRGSGAEFIRIVQAHVARVAVSPSATRNQGPGVVDAARRHLRDIQLRPFAVTSETRFRTRLDAATLALNKDLPDPSQSWGLSRKLLNIFLRDCLYNQYLALFYALGRAERFLEIPLDSTTARELRAAARPGTALPTWPGVRHLSLAQSSSYQDAALDVARARKWQRVHLDADWWGQK